MPLRSNSPRVHSRIHRLRAHWLPVAACLLAGVLAASRLDYGQQAPAAPGDAPQAATATPAGTAPSGTVPPSGPGASNPAMAAQMRQQKVTADSAELLKMATQLQLELQKTSSETLSLNVTRRAAEIERLAHSVRENLRIAAGIN